MLYPDHTLGDAMHLLAVRDVGRLPVVRREDPQRIVGLLRRHDIVRAYNKGLARRAEVERRVQRMRLASHRGGTLLTVELTPGAASVGYQVRDLGLPFGTVIVTIQREQRSIIPRGDTTLEAGDTVILMVDKEETEEKVRPLFLTGEGLPKGRETRYADYVLCAGSPAVGRSIADLGLPRDSLVVSIKRGGTSIVAHGNTVLECGDHVLVFAEVEDLPAVEGCMVGQNKT